MVDHERIDIAARWAKVNKAVLEAVAICDVKKAKTLTNEENDEFTFGKSLVLELESPNTGRRERVMFDASDTMLIVKAILHEFGS